MPKRILVTGANGQLGSELRLIAPRFAEYAFTFIDRNTLDFEDTDAIRAYLKANSFDVIINCAAYTAVDKAESDSDRADAINYLAVAALAEAAKEQHCSLVHISTDYVFDGTSYRPYVENDATNPQGVYGVTKLAGEEAILRINPACSAIIRTSWVYSEFGANFVKTMLRLGGERDELGVIFDQVGTPTYAADLAEAIMAIIPQLENHNVEIYHYSNEGVCSWYDFAKAIFELTGTQCRVRPIETVEYPTPAKRPHYSLLNKKKIKSDFSLEIRHWREALKSCLAKLQKENA